MFFKNKNNFIVREQQNSENEKKEINRIIIVKYLNYYFCLAQNYSHHPSHSIHSVINLTLEFMANCLT